MFGILGNAVMGLWFMVYGLWFMVYEIIFSILLSFNLNNCPLQLETTYSIHPPFRYFSLIG